MGWWEEAEERAQRYPGPYSMVHALRRRLATVHPDMAASAMPAYALANLYGLGCDLVQMVDSLLVAPTGDRVALRVSLLELGSWCSLAATVLEYSSPGFLSFIGVLDVDDTDLLSHPFSHWRLSPPGVDIDQLAALKSRPLYPLFERIDMALEACTVVPALREPLAWQVAEVYAAFLILIGAVRRALNDRRPRARQLVALLVGIHAHFHLHLGPRRLQEQGLSLDGKPCPGLPTRITWCLQALDGSGPAPEALSGSS